MGDRKGGEHSTHRDELDHTWGFFSSPEQVFKIDRLVFFSEDKSKSFLARNALSGPDWRSDCK